MSTAEVITFPGQQAEQPTDTQREVRVADCDNGYTRIANELMDAVLMADLTSRQLKIVIAIIRKTYGFNKKVDRISDEQISELTGIHRTHICNARLELIERKILIREGLKIGVNKVVSDWCDSVKNESVVAKTATENQNSYSVAKTATNNVAESATPPVAKTVHTKDNINTKDKEILKDITPPAKKSVSKKQTPDPAKQNVTDLDYSSWPNRPNEQVLADWLKVRAKKKSPLTQTAVNRLAKQFPLAAQHGFSVDDCLSECVVRGWAAFEVDWLLRNNRSGKPASSTIPRQSGFTYDQSDDQPVSGRL